MKNRRLMVRNGGTRSRKEEREGSDRRGRGKEGDALNDREPLR